MMEYKGYAARVEFDPDAQVFHGETVNTLDVVTFEGTSVEELEREFHRSIDVYLDFCAKHGKEPDKPFSGNYLVRMGPELHRELAIEAARESVSLNALIIDKLAAPRSEPRGRPATLVMFKGQFSEGSRTVVARHRAGRSPWTASKAPATKKKATAAKPKGGKTR